MTDDYNKLWADELPKLMMAIKQVVVNHHPRSDVTTKLVWRTERGTAESVVTDMWTIDDVELAGLMPSRAWVDPQHGLMFSFYASKSIPIQGRPFQDGPMYVLVLEPERDDVLEYDMETRLFIDQIPTPDGIKYVILFGPQQYNQLIVKN